MKWHRLALLLAACASLTAPAAAAKGVLNKEGYWTLEVGKDACLAAIDIEGGSVIVFSANEGEVSFAVVGAKPMRAGRKGVMATDTYSFDFEPSYGDDRSYLYVDNVLNDRAMAALRLAESLSFSVDGRRVTSVILTGTGFEGALDAMVACSNGQSGWWGKGLVATETADAAAPEAASRGGGTGTAFFVSADGLAVTAAHVVKDCAKVTSPRWGEVKVLAADNRADLAVLKAAGASGRYLTLRGRGPKLGETISAAGYPFGQALGSGLKITTGVVSGLAGPGGDRGLFQLSAPIQPGNSGGPVIDAQGALIGVTSSKLDEMKVADATGVFPQNVNFAVPVTILQSFLDENGVGYAVAAAAAGTTTEMPGYTFSLICVR